MRAFLKYRLLETICLLTCILLVPFQGARAELCALDPVPGATLLIPYFEVDLPSNCSSTRYDTELSITNVSAAPVVARVVVWSEWSVPVLGFNIFLTGYDVDTFKLSDVLCRGEFTNDSVDTEIDSDDLEKARFWLRGRAAPPENMCASHLNTSNKAIGYITIDNVSSENASGYPSDGASYVSQLLFDNVLLGDFYMTDSKVKNARRFCGSDARCRRRFEKTILKERGKPGARAVALEAGESSDFTSGDRTFYGRYNSADTSDRREPLPTIWHVRYPFTKAKKKFDLIVWREANSTSNEVSCLSDPNWHKLNMTQLVVFDNQSTPIELDQNDDPLGTLAFHDETQALRNALSGISFNEGWIYFNFNTTITEDNPYSSENVGTYVLLRRDGKIDETGVHSFASQSCSGSSPTL